jgi:hypothetical protein
MLPRGGNSEKSKSVPRPAEPQSQQVGRWVHRCNTLALLRKCDLRTSVNMIYLTKPNASRCSSQAVCERAECSKAKCAKRI